MPTISWTNPANITYGTPLGGTQLDATASVPGTFDYSPASGTVLGAGQGQTLSVVFTPTDTIDFNTDSDSVAINVAPAPATLSFGPLVFTYNGQAQTATVTTSPSGLSGVTIAYSQNGLAVTAPTKAGTYAASASLDNADYDATPITGTLTIEQATPAMSWTTPAGITYGTALSSTQLDATASVPGTFAYFPQAGTILVPARARRSRFSSRRLT